MIRSVLKHSWCCVSSQGSIFLFFAGRIEEIKGNLDAVSARRFFQLLIYDWVTTIVF